MSATGLLAKTICVFWIATIVTVSVERDIFAGVLKNEQEGRAADEGGEWSGEVKNEQVEAAKNEERACLL